MTIAETGRTMATTLIALAGFTLPMTASAKAGDPPTLQDAIGNPEGFTLSGSTRLRYEVIDGQARAGLGKSGDLVNIRTILTGDYRTGKVHIHADLFDSRAFDMDPGAPVTTSEINTMELVQAYVGVDMGGLLGKGTTTTVEAGRMMLNLGSRRLVAADDYRNTTNGYTGVVTTSTLADGTKATLFYVLPQVRLPEEQSALRRGKIVLDRESFDTQLWGGFLAKPKVIGQATAEIGYVGFEERDRPDLATRDRSVHALNARLFAKPKRNAWDYELEGIYEFGSTSTGTAATAPRADISAYFWRVVLGYSFPGPHKPRIAFEHDYASGDAPGGKVGRFDILYGNRRPDFGPSGIFAAIGRTNINSPGFRAEWEPTSRLEHLFIYRALWLADRRDAFSTTGVRDATGRSGNFAGHQFDTRLRWWVMPKLLRAEANFVYLAKREFLRNAPNAPRTGDMRYGAIALTATF